ncbi:MAG TPA: MmgE/PrpD family protein, partial [Candidatus Nanopelagicaceae bacterium]
MKTPTHVQLIADFAEATGKGVNASITKDVTERILDVIGNSLAGRAESHDEQEVDRATERLVRSWGGNPTSGVIGSPTRVPAASAALVNGTLAHSLDFDDTHLPSILHPSATIIPATLAVAEEMGSSPTALIAAAAAGIEICNRLGMASYLPEVGNSLFFEKGFHATS